MASSSVSLGPGGRADLYRGRVVALRGDLVVARLTSPGARPVQLRLALRIERERRGGRDGRRAGGGVMSAATAFRASCAGSRTAAR